MSSLTLRGQSTWRTQADSRLRAADHELSPSHSCALADGVSRRPCSCHLAFFRYMGRPDPLFLVRSDQYGGAGGVVLASWATAVVIRRQVSAAS